MVYRHFDDAVSAVESRRNFTGGGNTFVLVAELYKNNIMNALQQKKERPT
jgi:dipeptidase E